LVGLAGFILSLLDEPRTIDEIMVLLAKSSEKWPGHFSFSNTVLALDILYALKQIKLTNGDMVIRIS
jgi:hypothetical protein